MVVCNSTETLILNSSEVEFVSTVKTLGVIFHEHMLRHSYIKNLSLKPANIIGVLYKLLHIQQTSVKLLMIELFVFQNKTIRIVAEALYCAHTEPPLLT